MRGVLRAGPWWVETFTGLRMRQFAPLFEVSPATACRVIKRPRPLLAIEPATRPADAVDRPWIADGTLVPVRDRKTGASSLSYRFSANVQVNIDADTTLAIAAGGPVPGTTTDAKAWRDSGPAAVCEGMTAPADGTYLNTALVAPPRKRPGRALLPCKEDDNAEHRRVRARIEAAFARMKRYEILRHCRRRGNGLHHAVAPMHNLSPAA
ncbi:transposase family protein [Streptomyces sp. TLI_105]|uniref:transposase family protein n=1 Tax=Streptomyces sp. TLI_105 TaxID=1881019 RepID=UPI0008992FB9|nr:transposase family protein [Streptomyces sp. TLI_105]SEB63280.1 DDE superfamily endonuclease [Streptomyces sp. TLI_105]